MYYLSRLQFHADLRCKGLGSSEPLYFGRTWDVALNYLASYILNQGVVSTWISNMSQMGHTSVSLHLVWCGTKD